MKYLFVVITMLIGIMSVNVAHSAEGDNMSNSNELLSNIFKSAVSKPDGAEKEYNWTHKSIPVRFFPNSADWPIELEVTCNEQVTNYQKKQFEKWVADNKEAIDKIMVESLAQYERVLTDLIVYGSAHVQVSAYPDTDHLERQRQGPYMLPYV